MQLERTFTHTVAVNLILQVAIIPQRRWVIVGGDDGFIRIFNLDSGNFLFSLVHDERKFNCDIENFIPSHTRRNQLGTGCKQ